METLRSQPLSASLDSNLQRLREEFRDCSDLVWHQVESPAGPRACLLYMDGLAQKDLLDRDILQPLVAGTYPQDLARVASGVTSMGDSHLIHSLGEAAEAILSGDAVLLMDGLAQAVSYGVRGWQARAVSEPSTELSIRGPLEAFVETLRVNTALLRRRIKSPALKMLPLKIGRVTQTDVVVAYVEGIASPEVLQELLRRLRRIDLDCVLEGGYLEQLIEDSPLSPFPQIQHTERPDTAAANLLEGRFAVLVDGTPFVLILPVVFAQFLQASEDYYERTLSTSAIRLLRFALLFVALLLPSLYVSIITFHQEMTPTPLLFSIVSAREGTPFPALVEAFLMEVSFEVLREAGIRLPRTVGQAVSIVGALVIGQSAVQAGIVSAPMVIVVSFTGIASFAIPRYNMALALRLLRFPLMLLAGMLGMFGIVVGLSGLLIHLCSLRSFGVPYLSPVAPLDWTALKDTVVRFPLWMLDRRPAFLAPQDSRRLGAGQRPGPGPRR